MKNNRAARLPGEIPERFLEAWNRYDPAGIADLFVDNADFVNVVGKWWENKRDIFQAHDFGLRLIFQHSKMHLLRVKVKTLSRTVAVVHAHVRISGQTKKEVDQSGVRETMFLFVVKEINGRWLCDSAKNTDIAFSKHTNIRDQQGNLKPVSYKEKVQRGSPESLISRSAEGQQ